MESILYLFRPFLSETHFYTVNRPSKTLEAELSTILQNNKDKPDRINGHFRLDGSIDMFLFSYWLTIRSWDPYPVRLKARLRPLGPNSTELEIRVRPNAIFIFFTTLFPVILLLGWLFDLEMDRMAVLFIPFVFMLVLMPYGAAYYKKTGRMELEKEIGLLDGPTETHYYFKL